jgi:isopenicillin-N epimerase
MIGFMAAVPLPDSTEEMSGVFDPLGRRLLNKYRVQVPVFAWPRWPQHNIRISAAPYNRPEDYEALIAALEAEL